jgi:hypothetical protein
MLWIYYQSIADSIKEEILKEYKTLKGQCHIAVQKLYKIGLEGIPLSLYIRHPVAGWTSHVVFVTPDLWVIDATGGQYGNIPLTYYLEDITKYYDIIKFDIKLKYFYAERAENERELKLREVVKKVLKAKGIKYEGESE